MPCLRINSHIHRQDGAATAFSILILINHNLEFGYARFQISNTTIVFIFLYCAATNNRHPTIHVVVAFIEVHWTCFPGRTYLIFGSLQIIRLVWQHLKCPFMIFRIQKMSTKWIHIWSLLNYMMIDKTYHQCKYNKWVQIKFCDAKFQRSTSLSVGPWY